MERAALLVEDSEDDEALFRHVLKLVGLQNPLAVVRDGQQAISYLEGSGGHADRARHPLPEILFLDLRMPVAGGFAVLEWLQTRPEFKGKLLIVVLTQFGDTQSVMRAYALGAHSFLHKPFKQADLENLITHFKGYWDCAPRPTPQTLPLAEAP
jgi:CheY-like chemotaxis protein